ncbi:MAG: hypothetical protein HFE63_07970 [Clostridiales bacterium]|nr:hypothetical protein [Clostridiales bacterium]
MKKLIASKVFPYILVLIIFINKLATVYIPTFQLLDAIHYNIDGYIDDVLTNFINGTYLKFKEHRLEFEIIVKYVYRFIDSNKNFFDEYEKQFTLSKYGIIFYRKNPTKTSLYSKEQHLYQIPNIEWEYAFKHYKETYPESFYFEHELYLYCYVYQDYILFQSKSSLIFVRNRSYPQKYISLLWNNQRNIVNVIKYENGWYEIHY